MGHDLDIGDVVRIGKAYQSLGGSVQEQLDKLLSGEADVPDCNPNAIKRMIEVATSLDRASYLGEYELEDFLDWVR